MSDDEKPDEKPSEGWFKRYVVANLVTWVLVLLSAGVAWGGSSYEIKAARHDIDEIRTDAKEWTKERAKCASDIRVVEAKFDDLSNRVVGVLEAVDRVEVVVARLEAVSRLLGMNPPPSLRSP